MSQDSIYNHVLAAIDIHDNFQPVLAKAVALAKHNDAKLTIIHVDIDLRDLYNEVVEKDVANVQDKILIETKQKLDKILANIGYPIEHLIVDGDLVQQVTNVIRAKHIDLLVCGHHQTFWKLITSAARQLMSAVTCDMLVVPLSEDD